MKYFGLYIFLSVILLISYHDYINGGKSIFFADITKIEKINREIQLLEAKKKLAELKKELNIK